MATNKYIIEEKSKDIGDFIVGRYLPFRKKRQVGPFTFIDHMGPGTIGNGKYMDVDQHPHIGLSTLTYLLEGSIEHKDSSGSHQIIEAGDVGFMTAGSGVTHSERTPERFRDGNIYSIHGYQIWVALPIELEEMSPRFDYIPHDQLPKWTQDGLQMTLVTGSGYGRTSPLPVHSPLFMLDIEATENTSLCINGELEGEIGIVVNRGQIEDGEHIISQGEMMISKTENECSISLNKGTRVLLFGGPALKEDRYLLWNFVSHSKERLQKAVQQWKNKEFPMIPGDHTYIPIPDYTYKIK